MFDGIGHCRPFLASDTDFFIEFSKIGLGVATDRNAKSFEQGLKTVDENYETLKSNVEKFRKNLKWDNIADQHLEIYNNILATNEYSQEVKAIATNKPNKSHSSM